MKERTTIRLPDDLMARAKRRAAAEGRSLTGLIEDGLRRVLNERASGAKAPRILPPVSAATGGLMPGVDLNDTAAMQAVEDMDYAGAAWVILPDVNVLIYAFRKDSAQHAICKPWLDKVVIGDAQFGVSPQALSAVARITTNPRIFKEPSPIGEVFAYCDNLLNQPHCEIVQPGERHWAIFKRLCVETRTRGPRITDVWFAALAIEHACTWITYDRDYARFSDLDWREPAV